MILKIYEDSRYWGLFIICVVILIGLNNEFRARDSEDNVNRTISNLADLNCTLLYYIASLKRIECHIYINASMTRLYLVVE